MFKAIVSQIPNSGVYPVIGMLIFAALFCYVIVNVVCLKREYLKKMSDLPLDHS